MDGTTWTTVFMYTYLTLYGKEVHRKRLVYHSKSHFIDSVYPIGRISFLRDA